MPLADSMPLGLNSLSNSSRQGISIAGFCLLFWENTALRQFYSFSSKGANTALQVSSEISNSTSCI
jgi:hypothetical protein